jgi:GntR family transcriptional repressor for pyruvate dehydrogenase complex
MLRDLFEIRYLIEPASAGLAAQRAEPARIRQIADAVTAMRDAGEDVDGFYEADIQFHLAVFSASRNELIDRLSTILRPLLEVNFSERPQIGPGGMAAAYLHHAAVYDAIVKGDAAAANAAMTRLLDRASVELFGSNTASAKLAPGGETATDLVLGASDRG